MAEFNPEAYIVNIVGSGYFFPDMPQQKCPKTEDNCGLPLRKIFKIYPSDTYLSHAEYKNEKQVRTVIRYAQYHEYDKRVTITLFRSGTSIISGAATFEAATYGFIATAIEMYKYGLLPNKMPAMFYVNVVCVGYMPKPVVLDALALMLPEADYEPEQFPGLITRTPKTHHKILVFSTGRVVTPGVHDTNETAGIIKEFYDWLDEIGFFDEQQNPLELVSIVGEEDFGWGEEDEEEEW